MSKAKTTLKGPKGQLIYTDATPEFERNANGFALTAGGWTVTDPEWLRDVKRGCIKGFSQSAARRMRELLLQADYKPAGMAVTGVSLTLPAEAKDGDAEAVFDDISRSKKRLFGGWLVSLVWRKEVQRNGRVHYHCILWERLEGQPRQVWATPPAAASEDGKRPDLPGVCPALLVNAWIGGCIRRIAARGEDVDGIRSRMEYSHCLGLIGGEDDAHLYLKALRGWPCITLINGPGKGVEYLCDHSSKHKAYQSRTTGKAWGVWARASLPRVTPAERVDLTRWEWVRMARVARRLGRYWVPEPRSPWGWRWCGRYKRFRRGRSVVVNPDKAAALSRWLDYLRDTSPTGEPCDRADGQNPT